MTDDNVRDKIAKLLRLAENNDSVEEAAVAFARAQELATRHALQLDEIITEDEDEEPEPRVIQDIEDWCVDEWGKVVSWKLDVGSAVSRANGCKTYYKSGYRGRAGGLWMYGQPQDLSTARYLYDAITRQVDELAKAAVASYRKSLEEDYDDVRDAVGCGEDTPRTYGRDFRIGAAHEISRRFRSRKNAIDEERKRVEEARAQALSGDSAVGSGDLAEATTALVRVARAEEYDGRLRQVVDMFAAQNLHLGAGGDLSGATGGGSGYGHGREAGQGVNIGGKARGALR